MVAGSTLLALAVSGVAVGNAQGAVPQKKGKGGEGTAFALSGSGFGTRVAGGQVPAGSDTTAYQVIGCTNEAGLRRTNPVADGTLPDLGGASAVKTKVWTTKKDGVVASHSKNHIAEVELSDSPLGTLVLSGIKSVSKAYHKDGAFHGEASASLASIVFEPAGGLPPQEYDVPDPGQKVTVPGVATIMFGERKVNEAGTGATARDDALIVDLLASGSRVRIAHSEAQISGGIKSGIFDGWSAATQVDGLQGHIHSGRQPLLPMPCVGTGGEVRKKSIASLDLGDGQLVVDGLKSRQKANQTGSRAHGFTEGRIAGVNLGDGELVVDGIVARVNAERENGKLHRDIKGTELGTITVNGEKQKFPDSDVIKVPGLLKLERNVKRKIGGGFMVTALRVTLLDDENNGAVINLGQAKFSIHKAAR